MKYNPNEIEKNWQKYWAENQTFAAKNNSEKPKYYVLDMFPYPSGAGLHVGHPLGYIASDIVARYKRHQGFNVLHPQGYDSFGLPAEQYAIQTGQHPDKTTKENIARYREQLDKIGFSFDWSREVRTSNADYYKWTQWIFIQLFNSWYDKDANEARDIKTLVMNFEENGNTKVNAVSDDNIPAFSAEDWKSYSKEEQERILLKYRLTFLAETEVNWCPALGTVLANDEIVNGVSERGGHPVIRKKMTQWSMRISAYAERLLQGLDTIDWTESLKESQRNWIGKSVGASVTFKIKDSEFERNAVDYILSGDETNDHVIEVFTTRPDTIFGVTFMTLAPEHDLVAKITTPEQKQAVEAYIEATAKRSERERMADVKTISGVFTGAYAEHPFMTLAPEHDLVSKITTPEQKQAVEAYVEATAKRSERERMADVKTISGVFTGAYAEHPFTKEAIPVWIGDYVLAGYGTGAVMAVPCGDERDYAFAKHFNIDIKNIFELDSPPVEGCPKGGVDFAYGEKTGFKIDNSDFLNGLNYKEATKKAIEALEGLGQGKGKTNYRLRDAVFSRQRYWGEPFPVYYVNGLPQMIETQHLPIRLPEVEKYLPTEDGQPPLGNATDWAWDSVQNAVVSNQLIDNVTIFPLELNTMPGWAGSSWYWLRYMDAHNNDEFVSEEAQNYWQNVDLYIGGSEHATGHLLYSRFWNKFLKDRGFVRQEEPFKKLINQGMILGTSAFVYVYDGFFMDTVTASNGASMYSKKLIFSKSIIDLIRSNLELFHDLAKAEPRSDEERMQKYSVDKDKLQLIYKIHSSLVKASNLVGNVIMMNWFKEFIQVRQISVDVSYLVGTTDELNLNAFLNDDKFKEFRQAVFVLDNGDVYNSENDENQAGSYITGREVEKMSKSKYNVVTPDDICEEYGADTLRLYEMFLGPLEQAKPWNTAGITGVFGFLKKLWKLYFDESGLIVNSNPASPEALKSLHKTIKKVTEDIEAFSFNTSVSQFMIAVNELTAMKCHERSVLEPLAVLISPYAPHIAEELWEKLGHKQSISTVPFPKFNPEYLVESNKEYPVSFNGKMRFTLNLPLDLTKEQIEEIVMKDERTIKQLDGKMPNKVIIVPGKIINLVG